MSKKITKEQVQKVAELSKLKLSEEKLEEFSKMFSDTIDYIEVLDELDTKNTNPTAQVTGLKNVFLDDTEHQALTKEEALKNAKEVVRSLFAAEAVFDR